MIKYPSIKRLGHSANDGILEGDNLWVQEKLDGANFRFSLQRHLDHEYQVKERPLYFGSRNVEYKNEKDVDSTFNHAIQYVRENVNIGALLLLDREHGPLTFFGEAMHSHTINYDWENTPSFIGFDIYSEEYGEFLNPGLIQGFFSDIGFSTVKHHPLDVVEDGFDVPESEFYDGPAEGVVVKNPNTGQMAKVRSEKFKEMHSASHGKNPEEYEPEDASVLAHQFATEARILKMIHKYEDRGVTIEMGVMEDLWRDVFDDIIEEEYETIFLGNHTLDTQSFRSEVASRTANVLQSYLSRPNDSVLNEVSV